MSDNKNSSKMRDILKKYKHFGWALLFLPYGAAFMLVERLIVDDYIVSYSALDDMIPFIKEFVIPYCMWYPSMLLAGLWLLFKDADGFRRYIWALLSGLFFSVAFCFLFPNGQDLRPAVVEGNDICARLVRSLYEADTNTNVFPSMHVVGAMVVLFAVFDSKTVKSKTVKLLTLIVTVLVCASTVFIKQHSILDIYSGLIVSAMLYFVFYVIVKRAQENRRAAQEQTSDRTQTDIVRGSDSGENTDCK